MCVLSTQYYIANVIFFLHPPSTQRSPFVFSFLPPSQCDHLFHLWFWISTDLFSPQWFPAVLHSPIPDNKRPNLVGKPNEHGEGKGHTALMTSHKLSVNSNTTNQAQNNVSFFFLFVFPPFRSLNGAEIMFVCLFVRQVHTNPIYSSLFSSRFSMWPSCQELLFRAWSSFLERLSDVILSLTQITVILLSSNNLADQLFPIKHRNDITQQTISDNSAARKRLLLSGDGQSRWTVYEGLREKLISPPPPSSVLR